MRRWRRLRPMTTYGSLIPFIVFAMFPFYWMAVTSLKTNREIYDLKSVPFWIQQGMTLTHYQFLLEKTPFLTWLKNTFVISLLTTAISLVLGVLAAYPLSRIQFLGARALGIAIFVTYLVPTTLLFLPLSQVVYWLGLADSIWALVVTYPTFMVPFITWLLMGYFKTIPKEIEESAMVDGATRLQSLLRVVLPIAVPGLVSSVLFAFTLSWNEFIYGLTFVSSTEAKTVSVGTVAELVRGDVFFWGSLMAGAVVGSVPIVVVYVFFLDYYVSGLTAGAVK